jgi:hypothetical protein
VFPYYNIYKYACTYDEKIWIRFIKC